MTKETSGLMRMLKKKCEISRSAAQHHLSRFVISSIAVGAESPGSSAGGGSRGVCDIHCGVGAFRALHTCTGGARSLCSERRQPLDVCEFRKMAYCLQSRMKAPRAPGPRGPLQLAPCTITSQQLLRPTCTNKSHFFKTLTQPHPLHLTMHSGASVHSSLCLRSILGPSHATRPRDLIPRKPLH